METLAELRRKPHWSYSSLNQVLNICSLQWAYRKDGQIEPAFTPVNLVFGKAFHRACAQVMLRRMKGEHSSIAEAAELFMQLWRQEIRCAEPPPVFADDEEAALEAKGQEMLAALIQDPTMQQGEVVGVGVPFSVLLVDATGNSLPKPLIGEYDCLLDLDGLPVIVDWKTSASKWPQNKPGKDLQATAYLYAYTRGHERRRAVFRYDVVTKAKTPKVQRLWTTREARDYHRLVELAKLADHLVEAELFIPAEQGYFCGGCPYQAACREWHEQRIRQAA